MAVRAMKRDEMTKRESAKFLEVRRSKHTEVSRSGRGRGVASNVGRKSAEYDVLEAC